MIARSRLSLWSTEYSVNVAALDNQHQRLFLMVRHLDESIVQGQGVFTVQPLWEGLRSYADYHFRHEERLMEQSQYPGLARHREIHLALKQKLAELQQDYESGKLAVGLRSSDLIVRWLLDHISSEDKKLGSFLSSKSKG